MSFPPSGWSRHVRSAAIRVISLAAACLTTARGKVSRNGKRTQAVAAEVERLNQELALVREELRIKDARWSRITPQRRPHYARFVLTLKSELVHRILAPITRRDLEHELALFRNGFNASRPHMGIDGRTPNEVYFRRKPANGKPRLEPRARWPRGSPCANPQVPVRGKRGSRFALHVRFLEGRKHLPVVTLRRAS